MKHQVDHRNQDHGLTALCQGFIIFGQSAVLPQPGEGSLYDPALGQHHEMMDRGTLHDFHEAPKPTACPVHELSRIAAVGKDQFQSSQPGPQLSDEQATAIAILNVRRVNHERYDQTQRVDDDMTLAAKDFLPRVVPAIPPFSAVFTDWLSMMPTLGVGLLPTLRRTWARRRS